MKCVTATRATLKAADRGEANESFHARNLLRPASVQIYFSLFPFCVEDQEKRRLGILLSPLGYCSLTCIWLDRSFVKEIVLYARLRNGGPFAPFLSALLPSFLPLGSFPIFFFPWNKWSRSRWRAHPSDHLTWYAALITRLGYGALSGLIRGGIMHDIIGKETDEKKLILWLGKDGFSAMYEYLLRW